MAKSNELLLKITSDTSDINRGLKSVDSRVKAVSSTVKSRISGMSASFAKFGLAVQGVQQAFMLIQKVGQPFMEFQKGMAEVNTLMDVSNEKYMEMTQGIIDMTRRVPQSADVLAKGLYQTVSAGVDVAESLDFLELASRSATAGLTDAETAVRTIAGTLNAYNLETSEAGRISDILFGTIKKGITTFPELAQGLSMVTPVASQQGIAFEEVGAALATITSRGVPTAQATTQLGVAISEISKPSMKASKLIEELTGKTGKLNLEEKGLIGTMEVLATATSEQLLEAFGQRSYRAVSNLTSGMSTFAENLDLVTGEMDYTNEAFDKIAETEWYKAMMVKNEFNARWLELSQDVLPLVNVAMGALSLVIQNAGKIILGVIGYLVTYKLVMLGSRAAIMKAITATKIYRIAQLAMRNGIRATIASLRTLKATLISTGIGAIIVGLGVAYEYLAGKKEEVVELEEKEMTRLEKLAKLRSEMSSETDYGKLLQQIEDMDERLKVMLEVIEKEGEKAGTSFVTSLEKEIEEFSKSDKTLGKEWMLSDVNAQVMSIGVLESELERLQKQFKGFSKSEGSFFGEKDTAVGNPYLDKIRKQGKYRATQQFEDDKEAYLNYNEHVRETEGRIFAYKAELKRRSVEGTKDQVYDELKLRRDAAQEQLDALEQTSARVNRLTNDEKKLNELRASRSGVQAEINLYVARRNSIKAIKETRELSAGEEVQIMKLQKKINGLVKKRTAEAQASKDLKNSIQYYRHIEGKLMDDAKADHEAYLREKLANNKKGTDDEIKEAIKLKEQLAKIEEEKSEKIAEEEEKKKEIREKALERERELSENYTDLFYRQMKLQGSTEEEILSMQKEKIQEQLRNVEAGSQAEVDLKIALANKEMDILEWRANLKQKFDVKARYESMKNIVIESWEAMVAGIKSAADIAFPFNIIAIGATVGLISAALMKAYSFAKSSVTGFAEGGIVDTPTMALIGEKVNKTGPELVMPEVTFQKYMDTKILPKIMSNVSLDSRGVELRLERVENAILSTQITEAGIADAVGRKFRGRL